MKIEKHGRSFLIKNGDATEYVPVIIPKETKAPSKDDVEKQIAGLHKSGMCPIKEISITFGITEDETERIIEKHNKPI